MRFNTKYAYKRIKAKQAISETDSKEKWSQLLRVKHPFYFAAIGLVAAILLIGFAFSFFSAFWTPNWYKYVCLFAGLIVVYNIITRYMEATVKGSYTLEDLEAEITEFYNLEKSEDE
jgi:hypothetical protein